MQLAEDIKSETEMEVKDKTIIISLDDATKDNQENLYKGNNSCSQQGNSNGRWDGGPGFQRKTYYTYNYQRSGRQGHNPHYQNNGFNHNHPYNHNNGYNNHHHHHVQNNGYGRYGNRGNRGNNNGNRGGQTATHDQFHGNSRFHNNHNSHHHGHQQHHHRRSDHQHQPPMEHFSHQTELPFSQFISGTTIEPLVPTVPPGPVFNGPHFLFPEIQFAEPAKTMNLLESQRSMALTPTWTSYDPAEGVEETCPSLVPVSESPSSQGSSAGSTGTASYTKRISNGQLSSRVSPTPPQNQTYFRPFWDTRPFIYENRWNWNHAIRFHDLLDRFDYVDESEKPNELAPVGHEYEKLSDQIWTKFQNNQQTVETFKGKLELWRDLSVCVKKYNPTYQLEVVGSTISGFGSNSSDVDMCLILNHRNDVDPRAEAIDILEALCPLFEELVPNLTRKELILAKVPILKLRENVQGIDVDINVNNSVGVRNSLLLHSYALCDWRVRPLVLVVKLWAQAQGINDAKLMTLSSYSLALMVIHFLQHGVSPQILPSLQITYPDRFQQLAELWRVKKTLSDSVPAVETMDNMQSLGELLVGFLEYYAVKFDYRISAISVRNGATMTVRACSNSRAPKNDAYQWKHICIEEPFEFTNTARSVYDKDSFDRIRGVFFSSWQRLVISRNLDTIFQSISPTEARSIGARARQCSTS